MVEVSTGQRNIKNASVKSEANEQPIAYNEISEDELSGDEILEDAVHHIDRPKMQRNFHIRRMGTCV